MFESLSAKLEESFLEAGWGCEPWLDTFHENRPDAVELLQGNLLGGDPSASPSGRLLAPALLGLLTLLSL